MTYPRHHPSCRRRSASTTVLRLIGIGHGSLAGARRDLKFRPDNQPFRCLQEIASPPRPCDPFPTHALFNPPASGTPTYDPEVGLAQNASSMATSFLSPS